MLGSLCNTYQPTGSWSTISWELTLVTLALRAVDSLVLLVNSRILCCGRSRSKARVGVLCNILVCLLRRGRTGLLDRLRDVVCGVLELGKSAKIIHLKSKIAKIWGQS